MVMAHRAMITTRPPRPYPHTLTIDKHLLKLRQLALLHFAPSLPLHGHHVDHAAMPDDSVCRRSCYYSVVLPEDMALWRGVDTLVGTGGDLAGIALSAEVLGMMRSVVMYRSTRVS